MPLLALGHQMALSLLTLMLGGALAAKPRSSKRGATTMIRDLGFGLERNADSRNLSLLTLRLWDLSNVGQSTAPSRTGFLVCRTQLARPWSPLDTTVIHHTPSRLLSTKSLGDLFTIQL